MILLTRKSDCASPIFKTFNKGSPSCSDKESKLLTQSVRKLHDLAPKHLSEQSVPPVPLPYQLYFSCAVLFAPVNKPQRPCTSVPLPGTLFLTSCRSPLKCHLSKESSPVIPIRISPPVISQSLYSALFSFLSCITI